MARPKSKDDFCSLAIMPEKIRAHIFVSGRVQGVFFRQNTQKKAKDLGLTGWVRNLPDGRVEAVFEGPKEKVEEMIEWTRKSPMISRVDNIDISWEEYQAEFNDFEIKYDQ